MSKIDIGGLRDDFDKFVRDSCATNPQDGTMLGGSDKEEEEAYAPQFVDTLKEKLLAPSISGVYLSRLDIKRIAEAIGESLPIKDRGAMVKALFRHTTKKEYLATAFGEIAKHIHGRLLIYAELSEAFPASKPIFDDFDAKAHKMLNLLDQIILDFEEIEPSSDPLCI